MRRRSRRILAGLLLAALPSSLSADPGPPSAIPVEIERIGDRVLIARCPVGANVAAIVTDSGVVVVDTHVSPASMRAIRAKIEEATGQRRFPYVINTHGHWDHCSGNQVFPDATILGQAGAPAFMRHHRANPFGTMWSEEGALAEDRERLAETRDPERAADLRARIATREQVNTSLRDEYVPTPPNATFADRHDLRLGGVALELLRSGPAHTVTDIFVYLPGERIVLTGDVLCSPTSFCFKVGPLSDLPTLLRTIDRVLEGGADTVIPGHGRTMSGADLQGLRDRLAAGIAAQSGRASAARTLQRAIEEKGLEAALRPLAGVPPDTASAGYLSEEEFHILGNRFVEKADLDAAVGVFELAGGYFPKSSLIFTGLGRARLLRGDSLQAVSAFQRAYDLAPNNRQAAAMLRWLRRR